MPQILTCPHCHKRLILSTYQLWNHITSFHPEKTYSDAVNKKNQIKDHIKDHIKVLIKHEYINIKDM